MKLLFELTDYNIYKILLLLVLNNIILEIMLLVSKYIFEVDFIIDIISYMVMIVNMLFFYYGGYKLAIYKTTQKE